MNTPRKNYEDLQSPYAKSLAQYPSQSEEFLPFDLGGPGTGAGNHGNRQTPQRNVRYTSTPAKFDPYRGSGGGGGGRGRDSAQKFTPGGNYHQNRNHQQHRGRGNNRFYGISGAGNRQSASGADVNPEVEGEKNYQRQPHRYNTPRGGRGGGGGGQQRFHSHNKDHNEGGSYFHSSMLEDPWRELMQRHNAIRNSQINIQTQQEEQQQTEHDSSAESAVSEAEQNNDEL